MGLSVSRGTSLGPLVGESRVVSVGFLSGWFGGRMSMDQDRCTLQPPRLPPFWVSTTGGTRCLYPETGTSVDQGMLSSYKRSDSLPGLSGWGRTG